MSKKLYEETNIQGIANAIREKNGTQNQYTVAQMPAAVRAIETQPDLETLNATENGNYLPSAGKDGFSSVTVDVECGAAVVQPLSVTENGTYAAPSGVDGYSPVVVNVAGGGSSLPSGSKLLDYIESNGTQYIDTGHVLTKNGRMTFTVLADANYYRVLAGAEETNKYLSIKNWTATDWNFAYLERVSSTRTLGLGIHYFDFDINNQKFSLDYKQIESLAQATDSGLPNASVYMFAYIANGHANPATKERLFRASIYESGQLIHDYYPAIDPNNVVCLWDNVDHVFVYNAGTGNFIAGPVRNDQNLNTGDDWTSLKNYIESSGTQYIDTGYTMKQNSWIEMVANAYNAPSGNPVFFGVANSDDTGDFYVTKSTTRNRLVDVHGNAAAIDLPSDPGTFLGTKTNYKKSVSGIKLDTPGFACIFYTFTSSVTESFPLYIFTFNLGGSPYSEYAIMKLYRFRIYEGDTLVHEFIPWKDSNDVVCLKDTVTGNLKYNAGTGDFVYGTDS